MQQMDQDPWREFCIWYLLRELVCDTPVVWSPFALNHKWLLKVKKQYCHFNWRCGVRRVDSLSPACLPSVNFVHTVNILTLRCSISDTTTMLNRTHIHTRANTLTVYTLRLHRGTSQVYIQCRISGAVHCCHGEFGFLIYVNICLLVMVIVERDVIHSFWQCMIFCLFCYGFILCHVWSSQVHKAWNLPVGAASSI